MTLVGAKDDRLVQQGTTNVEAYQLYLKGRALLDRRGADVPAGLELFRKVVELDSAYSLAWAGVADAFTVLAYSGGSASPAKRIGRRAHIIVRFFPHPPGYCVLAGAPRRVITWGAVSA